MGRLVEQEPITEAINHADKQYLALLEDILENGVVSPDRTGTGTKKVFGRELRFDLEEGFPLLTTKRVFFRGVKIELLWMIAGGTNVNDLNREGVHIWDEWADESGDLGPIYGKQWRQWETPDNREIDQLARAISEIKNNPYSRRIMVTAWNPSDLGKMALSPCHDSYQFGVMEDRLSIVMRQRSADTFLGLPFNMAQYSLLLSMVAQVTDYKPGEVVIHLGDTHLYRNHFEQAREQMSRQPRPLPMLKLNPEIKNIDEFTPGDIAVHGYNPHPPIRAPISV